MRLGALTAAVLLAAAALWSYTGRSDSPGGESGGGQSSQGLVDFSLPDAAEMAGEGSASGGGHAARKRAGHTKPAISGPVSPVRPVISGAVPPPGRSFPPEVATHMVQTSPVKTSPVITSPVRQERRRPTTHPRTVPPHRAPEPRNRPAHPAPAPSPEPKQAPSTGPPTGGAPSNPGVTPTEPGATPTDPGTTPAPVPAADPDAGLDDTPAGGLDQTDLGEPIDEPPGPGASASPA